MTKTQMKLSSLTQNTAVRKEDTDSIGGGSPTLTGRDYKDPLLLEIPVREATRTGYAIARERERGLS